MNRSYLMRSEALLIVSATTYLAILWTVACIDGNDGVWRMLDKTLEVGFFWSQSMEKYMKYLDHRLAEQWVPTMVQGLYHVEALSSKALHHGGNMALQIASLLFYFLFQVLEKGVVFANRFVDTVAELIQLMLLVILKIFEPDGSNKLAFAVWAFICARILDRVVENREDVEFLISIVAKLTLDTIKLLIAGMVELSGFLIQMAIAYGVILIVQHFQHPIIRSLETFLAFKN